MSAIRLCFAAVVGVVVALAPARAHDHATGVVKDRMDMMETMARHMKAIGQRVKSQSDLAAIRKDALAIKAHAGHIVHMFPPGSTQPPTEARPEIWKNWPDFEAKAKAMETASGNLAEVDAGDPAKVSAAAAALSRSCSDCHERYRAKK